MTFLPEHALGWQNAWWFSLIYGLVSFVLMASVSKDRRKRILSFPKCATRMEKTFTGLGLFLFGRGLIIYTFFIPIKSFTGLFYIGAIIYLTVLILATRAMWTFTREDLSKPVTKGIYKITRHPMQVMTLVMWLGIGIAAGNWILIAAAFLLGIISLPSFQAQERFCIETYGESYLQYMKQTPRYLLF